MRTDTLFRINAERMTGPEISSQSARYRGKHKNTTIHNRWIGIRRSELQSALKATEDGFLWDEQNVKEEWSVPEYIVATIRRWEKQHQP